MDVTASRGQQESRKHTFTYGDSLTNHKDNGGLVSRRDGAGWPSRRCAGLFRSPWGIRLLSFRLIHVFRLHLLTKTGLAALFTVSEQGGL